MRSNFFNIVTHNRYIYNHMFTGTQRYAYTQMCIHTSTHTLKTLKHSHPSVIWWGLPVMVQAKICVPPHNKALSKLQDLCAYPLWSPPVGVMFSKVQVPKILIQFPSEASKNKKGKACSDFFFKFSTSYIRSLSRRKQGLIRGSFWPKFSQNINW